MGREHSTFFLFEQRFRKSMILMACYKCTLREQKEMENGIQTAQDWDNLNTNFLMPNGALLSVSGVKGFCFAFFPSLHLKETLKRSWIELEKHLSTAYTKIFFFNHSHGIKIAFRCFFSFLMSKAQSQKLFEKEVEKAFCLFWGALFREKVLGSAGNFLTNSSRIWLRKSNPYRCLASASNLYHFALITIKDYCAVSNLEFVNGFCFFSLFCLLRLFTCPPSPRTQHNELEEDCYCY